jgi:multidrug resistance efflux pump
MEFRPQHGAILSSKAKFSAEEVTNGKMSTRMIMADRILPELHAAEFALHVADFEIAQAEAALKQAQHPASEKSEPLRIQAPVDGYVLNVYEEVRALSRQACP